MATSYTGPAAGRHAADSSPGERWTWKRHGKLFASEAAMQIA